MTKSHKVIVLIPPFLIGFTILMTFFAVRHNQNEQAMQIPPLVMESATTTDVFSVTKELPPPDSTPVPPVKAKLPGRPDQADSIACPMDAKMCADGSFVGRTAPGCAFATCPSEAQEQECSPESRKAEVCAEIYAPVCAAYQVQCVTTPCPPMPKTYENTCSACRDNNVLTYKEGACALTE